MYFLQDYTNPLGIMQLYGRYEKAVPLEINHLNEKVNTLVGLNEQLAKVQREIPPNMDKRNNQETDHHLFEE